MKKIAIAVLLLFISIHLFAQQPADSAVNMSNNPQPADFGNTLSKYSLAFELTTNWLSPLPTGVTNDYIGGLGLAVDVQRKIFIIKKNFYFSFGLGIATYDYATNAQINYASTNPAAPSQTDYSFFQKISDSVNYSKNKLNLVWLQVPLEFHLKSNPNAQGKFVDFEFGGRFGLLINNHTKQKGTAPNGDIYKVKIYEIKNLNPIATMLTAKIGYDHANLFGYYNLLTLFKTNNGAATNELGAGISMTF